VPGGAVDEPGFAAITRYRDPVVSRRAVDKQVAHGMIHRRPDGRLSATERGAAFLGELYQVHAEVTEELWAGHDERVARLVAALGRLLAYALVLADAEDDRDWPAYAAMAPPPPGAPPDTPRRPGGATRLTG
jgi:hypothetical protein